MLCPYCSEYLRDDALRCRVCQGDLVLYRFLRAKVEAELGVDRQSGTTAKPGVRDTSVDPERHDLTGSGRADARSLAPSPGGFGHAMWAVAICVAALVLAYFAVGVLLKADGLPLRAISILVPLPLGIWFALHERPTHRAMLIASLVVPTLAMAGGRALASLWSGDALLGHDHTWDYLLSYWASIGFSFLTGAYIGELAHRHASAHLPATSHTADPATRRRELIARAKQLGPILGPIGTAVASFATGVGEYLGK